MFNKTEQDERQYLEDLKLTLRDVWIAIDEKVKQYAKEIRKQKEYLWENKTGMDHIEKINVRQTVDQVVSTGEAVQAKKKRIQKLLATPYFGRFDFIEKNQTETRAVYVGVHAFFDDEIQENVIYDWRAPISTMFYDYEVGDAGYDSPGGKVSGKINLKRQYRIRNGVMEFMLESAVSIHDDVLQKELSCASDDKMKNIVATIQRDQNAIIRNEASPALIIQGVAGSGKTSIALHRIAFLLYRFKDTITSNDILILSPNKVFADYISNVLPELGEEKIPEIGMEELANDLLDRQYKFQTFFEQVALLLEKNNEAFKQRIRTKASLEFLHKLNEYLEHVEHSYFHSVDLYVGGRLVPSWFMEERFEKTRAMPIFPRLGKIAKDVEKNIGIYYHYDVTSDERAEIKSSVKKMFKFGTLRQLYKDFYMWLDQLELFKTMQGSVFEYSDVFPLIYLKARIEGLKAFENVKHLLIDEMQDYTPVQYAVISQLFSCNKTILGDANQSVNPFSSSSANTIKAAFESADCVKLCKSYRSTYEITNFAQRISPNEDLEAIERHGEEPKVLLFKNEDEELQKIIKMLKDFPTTGYHSLGIICKTEKQAEELHAKLESNEYRIYLLTSASAIFRQGLVVCSAHMAKGLEFDQVIVPQATGKNYQNIMDKSMLYVACTRAMHKLTVTYVNKLTHFILENYYE